MTHYLNFIILAVQLLLVHSDSNYIYQKLLTTTIRAEVPHVVHRVPVNKNPIVSYSNAFFGPRTTTINPRYKISHFDKDFQEMYRRTYVFHRIQKYLRGHCFYEGGKIS
jgi:hypothetical protein